MSQSSPSIQQQHIVLSSRALVLIGFAALCIAALGLALLRSSRQPAPSALYADAGNAAPVQRGRQLYRTRGASCHGADLSGEQGWPAPRANGTLPAPPLDARGTVTGRSDAWIFTTIKSGGLATASAGTVSGMPALGAGLSDGEIWAIISYLQSTWPAPTTSAQP